MNGIDVGLLALLLLCGVRGSFRGFFRESFGFLGLVAGLVAALRGAGAGAAWLGEQVALPDLNATARLGIAFVVLFVAVNTLLSLLGLACDRVFGRTPRGALSRIGGGLFALGKGAAVLAFVLFFLHLFPVMPGLDRQITDSRVARPMVSAAGAVLRAGWRAPAAGEPQA